MHGGGHGERNLVDNVTATASVSARVLYLYSGPHRPNEGLAKFAKELGSDCSYVDKNFIMSMISWINHSGRS